MAATVIIVDRTAQIRAEIRAAASRALSEIAEDALRVANQTVPIEEGTLQRSGRAEVDGLTASVSYDTPYAVKQHEDPHLRHDPGRRDHWLERTIDENQRRYRDHMAAALREVR